MSSSLFIQRTQKKLTTRTQWLTCLGTKEKQNYFSLGSKEYMPPQPTSPYFTTKDKNEKMVGKNTLSKSYNLISCPFFVKVLDMNLDETLNLFTKHPFMRAEQDNNHHV